MPNDNASSNGDIQGVLSAELGNLQTTITGIDHFLMDTLYLVAENNCILLAC